MVTGDKHRHKDMNTHTDIQAGVKKHLTLNFFLFLHKLIIRVQKLHECYIATSFLNMCKIFCVCRLCYLPTMMHWLQTWRECSALFLYEQDDWEHWTKILYKILPKSLVTCKPRLSRRFRRPLEMMLRENTNKEVVQLIQRWLHFSE